MRACSGALDRVDVLLSGKVSAAAVAEAAHLSLSQLERLFSARLGLPVRRLVLWRRLRLAIRGILLGSTLTQAAHGAGFADAATSSFSTELLAQPGRRFRRAHALFRAERFQHLRQIGNRIIGAAAAPFEETAQTAYFTAGVAAFLAAYCW